jgi:hypothetical protein
MKLFQNKLMSIDEEVTIMINVDMLTNMFKIKYEAMDNAFSSYVGHGNRFLLVINIGKILDTLYTIINKKQLIITNKDRTKILVGLLNIIAHYRHYYFSIRKSSNFILLYCEYQRQYEEYEEILKELKVLLDFIPSIILIPKTNFPKEINEKKINNTFYYIHTIAYIIEFTKKKVEALGKKLIVNIFGNNPIEYQYLTISDPIYYLNPFSDNQILNYMNLWEEYIGNDERIKSPIYQMELKYLLLPYALLHNKMANNFPEKYKMECVKPKSVKTRANLLFSYIEISKGVPLHEFLNGYINFSYGENDQKYIEQFKKRYSMFYYNTVNLIKPFLQELIKSWGKKLKDNGIYNLKELVSSYDENNLNIGWLLEDKGE